MLNKEIAALAQKYLDGTASEEEIRLLHEWYNLSIIESIPESADPDLVKERVLNKIMYKVHDDLEQNKPAKLIRFKTATKWIAAASIAALVVLWSTGYWSRKEENNKVAQHTEVKASDHDAIIPGGNKAILTIDGKEVVILEEIENGSIKNSNGLQVTKNNGQLIFSASNSHANTGWSSVSTPRGGQYQVLLADGTSVWLNAASSLRFPAVFSNKQRLVELTGEAYFEVAKNTSMPFIVSVNNMKVEVLGTHFNIMSYADESQVNTTLLEGSVKVTEGTSTSMLKAGQQASLDKSAGTITVMNVDAEQSVAWKNGLFQFEGTSLTSVMNQLSRWYNVEVEYKGNFTTQFRGMISRNVKLEQVIKMLELTSKLHFRIEGRTITVMP